MCQLPLGETVFRALRNQRAFGHETGGKKSVAAYIGEDLQHLSVYINETPAGTESYDLRYGAEVQAKAIQESPTDGIVYSCPPEGNRNCLCIFSWDHRFRLSRKGPCDGWRMIIGPRSHGTIPTLERKNWMTRPELAPQVINCQFG